MLRLSRAAEPEEIAWPHRARRAWPRIWPRPADQSDLRCLWAADGRAIRHRELSTQAQYAGSGHRNGHRCSCWHAEHPDLVKKLHDVRRAIRQQGLDALELRTDPVDPGHGRLE